jgi:O-antigen/teichoic acid export membrane protein
MKLSLLSNAIWSMTSGISGAAAALLLPPFLTHRLDPASYGAWALALQIGAYINLLGFGLQVAVGRYVAIADAESDRVMRDGIVATAFYFLTAAAALGFLILCALASKLKLVIPSLPPGLLNQTSVAIAVLGVAFAVNLPATIFAAVFTGMRRADVPAIIQGGGRLAMVGAVIVAVQLTTDLRWLAAAYTVVSLATAFALWVAWRRKTALPRIALAAVSRSIGRELAGYCLSLTIWNLSMLMVNGLDTVIVARWDLAALPYFAVSVTLATFVSGIVQSLANPIIPESAAISAANNDAQLDDLLVRGSRVIVGASILATVPLVFAGGSILQLWLGSEYTKNATFLLAGLAIASWVRNLLLTYVMVAIGTGLQRKLTATPLIEGSICIIGALALVGPLGAAGVVYAKILGGLVGITLLIIQNPLQSSILTLRPADVLRRLIVRPSAAWVPLLVLLPMGSIDDVSLNRLLVTMVMAAAAVWMLSLRHEDRKAVYQDIRRRSRQLMSRMPS